MSFLRSIYSCNPISGRKELCLTPHFLELRYGEREQANWKALVESDARLLGSRSETYTQDYLETQERVDGIVKKMSLYAQREGRPVHYEATLIDRSVISYNQSLAESFFNERTLRFLKSHELINDLCVAPGGKLAVLLPFVRIIDTLAPSDLRNVEKEDVLAAVIASGIAKSILGHTLKRKNLENVCNLGQALSGVALGFGVGRFVARGFEHARTIFSGAILSSLSFSLLRAVSSLLIDEAYYANQTEEADECAIRLMHMAGYEMEGFPIMLTLLTNQVSTFSLPSLTNRFLHSDEIIEMIKKEDALRLIQLALPPESKDEQEPHVPLPNVG